MAEVLAVASGVAGLLSLTIDVYSVSSRYISCVKHASTAVLDVQRELKALKTILSELDKAIEHGETEKLLANRPSALGAIEDAEEYREALQRLQTKLMKESSKTGFSAKLKTFAWPFNEERTQSILDVLRRHVNIFGQALSIDSYWVESEILKEVQFLGREKREKMMATSLEWLSPAKNDMQPKQHDFFSKRVGTTGDWLLQHDMFKEWIDMPLPPVIWCSGDPGTGKTILASIVVDHLSRKCVPDGTAYAVIFCDYKDQAAQTTLSILGNIAKQLIQSRPSGFKALEELYDSLQSRSGQPSVKDFEALILSVCSSLKDTFVIIDALDELLPEHRKALFPIIRSLQQNAIKVLVTSRPNFQDIERAFRNQTKVTIQASDADVLQLVQTAVNENEDLLDVLEEDEKLKEEIISATTNAAHGMILLPVLQLKHLNGLFSKAQIRRALTTMPKDVFGMYSQTVTRIKQQGSSRSKLALTILGWITLTKRPLLINELRHALAVEFQENEDRKINLDVENLIRSQLLLDVCAGLVSVEAESQVVRLVHFTAQEYLNQNIQSLFADIPAQIAGTCLTYLLLDDLKSGPCLEKELLSQRLEQFQFLEYASVYWGDHLRGSLETQFLDLTLELLRCDKRLCASVEACNLREPEFFRWCNLFGTKPDGFGPLHCAAAQGLDRAIQILLDEGADACGIDGTFKTPVHWAAWRGHCSSLKILLDTGVDVHLASEDDFSLLETAVDQGREEATRLLLERGFDIDRQGFGKNTALITAALMGHERLVKLLLEKGADKTLQNQFGETALFKAAIRGHEEISRMLLDRDMDVQQANACGNTALHCAAFSGRSAIVTQLLEAGTKIDLRTINGVTALHMAASQGHDEVVRLLIAKGADIEAKTSTESQDFEPLRKEIGRCIPAMVRLNTCGKGATALFEATLHGQPTVVKSLIQLGADIRTTNITGQPLLLAAAQSAPHNNLGGPRLPLTTTRAAAMENTHVLLSHGANVNAASNSKLSALHVAASDGFLELVQFLTENGAAVDAKTVDGENAFHFAAKYGMSEVVEWFIAQGLDPNVKNNNGCTMFHLAASNGNVETMKVLLDSDSVINIEECDSSGLSPLIRSIWSKKTENVQFLLDRGADIDRESPKFKGVNVAYSAVHNEEAEILKLLIDRGARLDVISEVGTLLHLAAQNGKMKTLPILIESGISQTTTTQNGKTALHLAAKNGKTEALRYLLDHGSEIDAIDEFGQTALRCAVAEGHEESVSLLLAKGSNVRKISSGDRRDDLKMLDVALQHQRIAIAQLLIDHGADKLNDSNFLCMAEKALDKPDCSVLRFLIQNDEKAMLQTSYHSSNLFYAAAQSEDLDFAKFLIEKGFNFNGKDARIASTLSLAIQKKNLSMLEFLLETGADASQSKLEDSLVHSAVDVYSEDIAIFLINHQVNFDRKHVLGRAAQQGMKNLVQLLLVDTDGKEEDINLDEILHFAIWNGRFDISKLLLEKGANANSQDSVGTPTITLACIEDDIHLIELLLNYGADINARNSDHKTPLHCSESLRMTQFLVQRGANLKAVDKHGWTPLHYEVARLRGDKKRTCKDHGIVQFLISAGADLNISDVNGYRPLHVACSVHSISGVEQLLAAGAEVDIPNSNGDRPFHSALMENSCNGPEEFYTKWHFDDLAGDRVVNILELLLQHGAGINKPGSFGQTPLHCAVESSCSAVICKWLLDKGADVNVADKNGDTPLVRACILNDPGVCTDILLNHGVDIHKFKHRYRHGIECALVHNNWRLADDLIQHGIVSDKTYIDLVQIKIHSCARWGYSSLLGWLLSSSKVDIEETDSKGFTALGAAVECGELACVQILLDKGANPNAVGPCPCGCDGAPIIHLAAHHGNSGILRALLLAGANANIRNHKNNTALMWAAEFGRADCLKALLETSNIDVNAVDDDGDSALICAVSRGHVETTGLLLARHDVNRSIKNKAGFTAENSARTATVRLLFKAEKGDKKPLSALDSAILAD